jgi:hypothetical protein
MMMGPPGPDVDFEPTQSVHIIAFPFIVIAESPVVSGEQVPFAMGSIVGVVPPDPTPLLLVLPPLLELPLLLLPPLLLVLPPLLEPPLLVLLPPPLAVPPPFPPPLL